jgi:KaiC/GvpD/RAD55 family RecA-like ATPase
MKKGSFKDCVDGLSSVILHDVPEASICLVTGAPGTLKTSFVYTLMANYLKKTKETGLYLSLEQSAEQIVKNMENMGVKKPETLEIMDFASIRKKYRGLEEKINVVSVIEESIDFIKNKNEDFTVFALDSLNALNAFSVEEGRRAMYHFFNGLRERGLTSFIVYEVSSVLSAPEYSSEYFLADAIFELGILEKREDVARYIQVRKLRGSAHSMKKHRIVVDKGTIQIMGPVYV